MYEEEKVLMEAIKPLFDELQRIRDHREADGAVLLVRKCLNLFEDGFGWQEIRKEIAIHYQ